jgi:hypothetical protein
MQQLPGSITHACQSPSSYPTTISRTALAHLAPVKHEFEALLCCCQCPRSIACLQPQLSQANHARHNRGTTSQALGCESAAGTAATTNIQEGSSVTVFSAEDKHLLLCRPKAEQRNHNQEEHYGEQLQLASVLMTSNPAQQCCSKQHAGYGTVS